MPMDAWRDGDTFHVEFDLPGVEPGLDRPGRRTQRGHRQGRTARRATTVANRWPPNARGACSAGSWSWATTWTPSTSRASYDAGVLSLDIPVAEKAKPRKITVTSNGQDRQAINA